MKCLNEINAPKVFDNAKTNQGYGCVNMKCHDPKFELSIQNTPNT